MIRYLCEIKIKDINKLSLSADYFIKTVDDLLFNPNLSGYLGIPQYPVANIGSTETTGIDANLNFNSSIGDDFKINVVYALTLYF